MTSPVTSRHSIVPLDSYRLAQYMKPIACFICGEGNTFDSELCHLCHAPMALAHQANDQQVEPQMIAVIGAAGAGKTVYLGMLTDMLSSCNSELQLLARGAFSISLQQATIAALARCDFPDKTPNEPDRWNWMHYQAMMSNRRHPLEIMIPDMAGEALLEEINHPHSYPVIRAFLSKCTGALLLIDASRLENGDRGHDLTGMKILSYLRELNEQRQRKDQITRWRSCSPKPTNATPVSIRLRHSPSVTRPAFGDIANNAGTAAVSSPPGWWVPAASAAIGILLCGCRCEWSRAA